MMMRKLRYAAKPLVFALLLSGFAGRAQSGACQEPVTAAPQDNGGIKISLRADKTVITPDEHLDLMVTYENFSKTMAWIDDVAYKSSYDFSIVGPNLRFLTMTARARKNFDSMRIIGDVEGSGINPGGFGSRSMQGINNVQFLYDMTQPGEYSLRVSRQVFLESKPPHAVTVTSNAIKITVLSEAQIKQREAKRVAENAKRLRQWRAVAGRNVQGYVLKLAMRPDSYEIGLSPNYEAQLFNYGEIATIPESPSYRAEIILPNGDLAALRRDDSFPAIPLALAPLTVLVHNGNYGISTGVDGSFTSKQPGKYLMRISLQLPARDGSGKHVTIYSNIASFDVKAPPK